METEKLMKMTTRETKWIKVSENQWDNQETKQRLIIESDVEDKFKLLLYYEGGKRILCNYCSEKEVNRELENYKNGN